MGFKLNGKNPLAYMGVRPMTPPQLKVNTRRPTANDIDHVIGTFWIIPTAGVVPSQEVWVLVSVAQGNAVWIELDSGGGQVIPGAIYTLLTADGSGGYGVNVGPGTAGQVLLSGGAGANPDYVTPTAGTGLTVTTNAGTLEYSVDGSAHSGINVQTFTTSGTYTPTAGMKSCIVEIVGGGGGAAGSSLGGISYSPNGGSGAGFCRKVFTAATIGASQSVVIGTGGAGGVGDNGGGLAGSGSHGVNSTFLTLTAGRGLGGNPQTTLGVIGAPVDGGTATGGDLNIPGQPSPTVQRTADQGLIFGLMNGGATPFGYGGQGSTHTAVTGPVGTGYGSGGGPAFATGSSESTGGAGAPGICIITEYI